jgi:hypothetical protein
MPRTRASHALLALPAPVPTGAPARAKYEEFQLTPRLTLKTAMIRRPEFREVFHQILKEKLANVDFASPTATMAVAIALNKGDRRLHWYAEHIKRDGTLNSVVSGNKLFERWMRVDIDRAVEHVDAHLDALWDERSKLTLSHQVRR